MFYRKIDKDCMQIISKEEIQTPLKQMKKYLCAQDYTYTFAFK